MIRFLCAKKSIRPSNERMCSPPYTHKRMRALPRTNRTLPACVQWFFSDNTGVEQFVEEFAKKNKDVFDLEAEEHKHECE